MALSQAGDHVALNLPVLGLYWMISEALIIGMEDLEERGWKSGFHEGWVWGTQREWTSDVSSDQEIICVGSREERKSDLSLQEGEGRDSHGVPMCPSATWILGTIHGHASCKKWSKT